MELEQNAVAKFLDPENIITQIGVEAEYIVADFGCGPGYFSLPMAKAVANGKVYSFDILPQALETVAGKAKNAGLNNIVTKRVNLEKENGSKLESNFVDLVILKDILFQNKNKKVIIAEARRVLKDGGRVLVVEWNNNDQTIGPEESLRIAEDALKRMFEEENFSIEKDVKAGDFHYSFLAKK